MEVCVGLKAFEYLCVFKCIKCLAVLEWKVCLRVCVYECVEHLDVCLCL